MTPYKLPPETQLGYDDQDNMIYGYTCDEFREEIERVRRETLEEAAKISEGYPKYGAATAEEIRSLK